MRHRGVATGSEGDRLRAVVEALAVAPLVVTQWWGDGIVEAAFADGKSPLADELARLAARLHDVTLLP